MLPVAELSRRRRSGRPSRMARLTGFSCPFEVSDPLPFAHMFMSWLCGHLLRGVGYFLPSPCLDAPIMNAGTPSGIPSNRYACIGPACIFSAYPLAACA